MNAPPVSAANPPTRRMRLRYPGTCRSCRSALPAGEMAIYHTAVKQVECLSCSATTVDGEPVGRALNPQSTTDQQPADSEPATTTADIPVDPGTAGASARREYERRLTKREERIRSRHPKLGGLILAVTDEPQSTRAWEVGARGEERLAKRLDALIEHGALVLHDRRIPGSRANIDHIVVAPTGVFVIDAKRYKGRPHLRIEGGIIRPRVEKLIVGSRDCTKLVGGVTKQVDLVRTALDRDPRFASIPVRGMLAFVEADWPLFGGAFMTDGVQILWPKRAVEQITAVCESPIADIAVIHRYLAAAFPVA